MLQRILGENQWWVAGTRRFKRMRNTDGAKCQYAETRALADLALLAPVVAHDVTLKGAMHDSVFRAVWASQ